MLIKIFDSISSQDGVSFESIRKFFEKCSLFYLYYNIRPEQLNDLIRENARTKNGFLTLK
jgi:hypothetical protein